MPSRVVPVSTDRSTVVQADVGLAQQRGPHVAHVLPWSNIGGTEIATLRLIRAATAAGYRATAFHLPDAHSVRELFESHGVDVAVFPEIQPGVRRAPAYVRESRELAQRFRQLDVRAIHCADVRSAFMCGLAGRLAGATVICHVRNRYREFPFRWRQLLRQTVDHFVFVSLQTQREFPVQLPAARSTVLYDGVRVSAGRGTVERNGTRARMRAGLGIDLHAPIIGMVARVARQKDYETLIRAAAVVVRKVPAVRFLMVGDHESAGHDGYYQELQELIAALGLERHFVFTGQRTDVDDLLRAMDVFVLSTHWEGFPLVILEAMGHALPVVATAVDGIPEIVADRQTGMLISHGDSHGLAKALLELVTDRALARRLGANAFDRVAREFSDVAYAASVTELYSRVVAPRATDPTKG